MPDTPPTAALSLVDADRTDHDEDSADHTPVDQPHELSLPGATSATLIAELEHKLSAAATQEVELAHRLDTQRAQNAALAEELRDAHDEAIAASIEEATRRSDAILTEAETSRKDAEREAIRIIKEAFAEAKEILAEAEQEGAAIVKARQQELAAVELDATRRVEELETQHEELADRIELARKIYEELQGTLKQVAQTSLAELAEAKASLARLDPSPPTTPRRRSIDRRPSPDTTPPR